MNQSILKSSLVTFLVAAALWVALLFVHASSWPSAESPPRQGEALDAGALSRGLAVHSKGALARVVREPQNTWSNLAFVFVGAILFYSVRPGFHRQFAFAFLCLGLGSFFYHASASRFLRHLDVAAMFWVCLYLIVASVTSIRPRVTGWLDRFSAYFGVGTLLFAASAAGARNVHVFGAKPLVVSLFTILSVGVSFCVFCYLAWRDRTKSGVLETLVVLVCLGLAAVCEEGDRPGHWGCNPEFPIQLHAVWHVLGALGCGAIYFRLAKYSTQTPNQSLEPMARSVTPRAEHESRRISPWLIIKR